MGNLNLHLFVTFDTRLKFADQSLLTYFAILVRPGVYPNPWIREPADFIVRFRISAHPCIVDLCSDYHPIFESLYMLLWYQAFETVSLLLGASHFLYYPKSFLFRLTVAGS